MNSVRFTVDAKPENKELIEEIQALIIKSISSTKTEITKTETVETPGTETVETPGTETVETDSQVKYKAFVDVAAKTRQAHGIDFLKDVLKEHGAKMKQSIPKTLSAVHPDKHEDIMASWSKGPVDKDNDDFDDDFDDDKQDSTDTPNVDPEAVRTALKAYSKTNSRDEAKEIMKKYKVSNLSKLDEATQQSLAGILKEIA